MTRDDYVTAINLANVTTMFHALCCIFPDRGIVITAAEREAVMVVVRGWQDRLSMLDVDSKNTPGAPS